MDMLESRSDGVWQVDWLVGLFLENKNGYLNIPLASLLSLPFFYLIFCFSFRHDSRRITRISPFGTRKGGRVHMRCVVLFI